MKEFILVILILITIGFCITKICEAIMYDKFLKNKQSEFDKILNEALEMTKKQVEEKKEEKKVAKKTTTRKTKKSEKKEEK